MKFIDFETWMKNSEENFEVWDDFLKLKAYLRLEKDLTQEISHVENAQHLHII